MKRAGLYLAIAIVLVTNGVTLIGVAGNRAGEPFETIELTERELPMQAGDQESSGIMLRLMVSTHHGTVPHPPLDRARLEALGFRFPIAPPASGTDLALLPRTAFVALEYDGPVWQQWLQRAEEDLPGEPEPSRAPGAAERLQRDRVTKSRLFVIDTSQDMAALRARHPDQSKVLIVKAIIRARIEDVKDLKSGEVIDHNVIGTVAMILPSDIHVPLPYSRLLAPLKPAADWQEPRYTVTLQYGRRLEPRVSAVTIH